MALRIVRSISLFLTALLAGLLFCHLLELPDKMKMPAVTWLTVQHTLYNRFGPVASVIEPLAILSTLILAVIVRRRRLIFAVTLLALICLVAHLAEFFTVVNPMNLKINSWTIASLPADWIHARAEWEYGHSAGAVLTITSLAALIAGAVADTGAGITGAQNVSVEKADARREV